MTPERMAGLVARWVLLYTRKLPTAIAERRREEIEADLYDHVVHERAAGASDRRIALGLASRMLRGLASDVAWRGRHTQSHALRRSMVRVVLPAALILSVPLVAMQFTNDVVWSPLDFAVAGTLLVGTGLLLELALRKAGNLAYRAAAALAIATAFLLVWSNLAVGIVGDPDEPVNGLYLGVLAVGIAGAAAARFRPAEMARALLATALAQALVAVIALIAGAARSPVSSVSEVVGVNAFFVALFVVSALLFRYAGRERFPEASNRRA